MMRLDRAHFSLLAALARLGSLSAAAADLAVTQSAASQRLREAERRMGAPLVQRSGKRVRLNRAGLRLAEAGMQLDQALIRAEAEAQWLGRNEGARFRIGVGFYDMPGWFVGFGAALDRADVAVEAEWVQCRDRDVPALLASEEIDAAFLPNPRMPPGMRAVPLVRDSLVAVAAARDPLAERDALQAVDLEGRRYIAAGYIPQAGFEFEQVFRPEGRYPRQVIRVESAMAGLSVIAAGQGVSILPGYVLRDRAVPTGLRILPLAGGPFEVVWTLLLRPGAPEAAAACLIDFLEQEQSGRVPPADGSAPARG